jgi:hypothetical protein
VEIGVDDRVGEDLVGDGGREAITDFLGTFRPSSMR